jgi:hypothetical protein
VFFYPLRRQPRNHSLNLCFLDAGRAQWVADLRRHRYRWCRKAIKSAVCGSGGLVDRTGEVVDYSPRLTGRYPPASSCWSVHRTGQLASRLSGDPLPPAARTRSGHPFDDYMTANSPDASDRIRIGDLSPWPSPSASFPESPLPRTENSSPPASDVFDAVILST